MTIANDVFQRMKYVATTSSTDTTVSSDRSWVSAPSTEARSETTNQCLSSTPLAQSEIPVMLIDAGPSTGGDWVGPPPWSPENHRSARNAATPTAMMLMATPDTMWSTPKMTVASACSAPPIAPNTIAAMTACQGP